MKKTSEKLLDILTERRDSTTTKNENIVTLRRRLKNKPKPTYSLPLKDTIGRTFKELLGNQTFVY